MRIVVALGGNALLKRGEPMTAERQRANVRSRRARSPRIAAEHQLVLSRTGTVRRWACSPSRAPPYADGRALPARRPRRPDRGHDRVRPRAGARQPAAVRDADGHDPDDGRGRPGGPGLRRSDQVRRSRLRRRPRPTSSPPTKGWVVKPDGAQWRRVVPSPVPKTHLRDPSDPLAARHGVVVICAGGGGVPTMFEPGNDRTARRRRGGHRQGPRQRAARPRARRRPVRAWRPTSTACTRTGARRTSGARSESRPTKLATRDVRRRARWDRRSRPPREFVEADRPSAPRSGRSTQIERIVDGTARHAGGRRTASGNGAR